MKAKIEPFDFALVHHRQLVTRNNLECLLEQEVVVLKDSSGYSIALMHSVALPCHLFLAKKSRKVGWTTVTRLAKGDPRVQEKVECFSLKVLLSNISSTLVSSCRPLEKEWTDGPTWNQWIRRIHWKMILRRCCIRSLVCCIIVNGILIDYVRPMRSQNGREGTEEGKLKKAQESHQSFLPSRKSVNHIILSVSQVAAKQRKDETRTCEKRLAFRFLSQQMHLELTPSTGRRTFVT